MLFSPSHQSINHQLTNQRKAETASCTRSWHMCYATRASVCACVRGGWTCAYDPCRALSLFWCCKHTNGLCRGLAPAWHAPIAGGLRCAAGPDRFSPATYLIGWWLFRIGGFSVAVHGHRWTAAFPGWPGARGCLVSCQPPIPRKCKQQLHDTVWCLCCQCDGVLVP